MEENIRSYNVGGSDYAKHEIQPWDIWEYIADPWRADIVKRILRTKKCSLWDRCFHPDTCDSRLNDYKKIRHILLKIDDLLEKDYVFAISHKTFKTVDSLLNYVTEVSHLYKLNNAEAQILIDAIAFPNNDYFVNDAFIYIDYLIQREEHNTPTLIKLCNKLVKLIDKL